MDTVEKEVRRRASLTVGDNERIAFISIKTETKIEAVLIRPSMVNWRLIGLESATEMSSA
jgi:hypothetical protein